MAASIGWHVYLISCPVLLRNSVISKRYAFTNLSVRTYAKRGFYRKPLRALTSEEAQELENLSRSSSRKVKNDKTLQVDSKSSSVSADTGVTAQSKTMKHGFENRSATLSNQLHDNSPGVKAVQDSEIDFEKLREGDKRFGPVILAARSKKSREKEGKFLLEGHRLINEAIHAGIKVETIYFTNLDLLNSLNLKDLPNVKFFKVMKSHMTIWSDVSTPQGLIAICKIPAPGEIQVNEHTAKKLVLSKQIHAESDLDSIHSLLKTAVVPITLICDQIRDPGNMGNILRTAAAIGCQLVMLTKGCVDMWEPKVLRSSAGAHFKTRILNNIGWEHVGNYLPQSTQICLADNRFNVNQPNLGSKKQKEAMRQVLERKDDDIYMEENEETGETLEVNQSFVNKKHLAQYDHLSLPSMDIFKMDFSTKGTALVIGGETEGVSVAARKLCFDHNGDIVYLPMLDGVESLNAGTAAAVILYEMKRQIIAKQTAKIGEKLKEGSNLNIDTIFYDALCSFFPFEGT